MEAAVNDMMRPALGSTGRQESLAGGPSVKTPTPAPSSPPSERLLMAGNNSRVGVRDLGPAATAQELTFEQVLDTVNPLHHIPVVGSLYREATGDEIDAPSRMVGSVIFGGPVGLISSFVNVVAEETSGKDIMENLVAWVDGEDTPASGVDSPVATVPPTSAQSTEVNLSDGHPPPAPEQAAQLSAPAENAAANLPPPPEGALTGLAALQALAADLHGTAPPASEPTANPPAPAPAMPTVPEAPLAEDTPGPSPLTTDDLSAEPELLLPANSPLAPEGETASGSLDPAQPNFTEKMMVALEKYSQLMEQRNLEKTPDLLAQ